MICACGETKDGLGTGRFPERRTTCAVSCGVGGRQPAKEMWEKEGIPGGGNCVICLFVVFKIPHRSDIIQYLFSSV